MVIKLKFKTNLKIPKSLIQLLTYSLVGLSNMILDLLIVNILMKIFNTYNGPLLMAFNIISFLLYSLNGYVLNKKFTFKSEEKSYLKYMIVLGGSVIIESPLFSLLTTFNIFSLDKVLWANICKIISFTLGGVMCFLINKFLIFKDKKSD
ncbi:GtrA family protein [Clostridium cadaveris]|uniref:GtrA family protein n=2 Tax=Clostridium cadaveris TaxID=1529 RepID=A0A316MHE1_9CLOT|nr:MAG: GtrA family protein [Clostridium cadaveris]